MKNKAKIIPLFPDVSNEDLKHLSEVAANLRQMMDDCTLSSAPMFMRQSKVHPTGKKGLNLTYQFKVKLRGASKPPVWRRVLVPSYFTFSGFHAVIQESFGWYNEHLYNFVDVPYSRTFAIAEIIDENWDDEPDYDARKYTLSEFYGDGSEAQKLCYVYDFGDDWIHDIELEKVFPEHSDHASCLAGKGACPEEDCGGIWGYNEMKASGEIDATYFDIEEVEEAVANLPYDGYESW